MKERIIASKEGEIEEGRKEKETEIEEGLWNWLRIEERKKERKRKKKRKKD